MIRNRLAMMVKHYIESYSGSGEQSCQAGFLDHGSMDGYVLTAAIRRNKAIAFCSIERFTVPLGTARLLKNGPIRLAICHGRGTRFRHGAKQFLNNPEVRAFGLLPQLHFPFALSPVSTSRRMASGRPVSFAFAQASA